MDQKTIKMTGDDRIIVCLPSKPENVSSKVIPKVIDWFAQPPHCMEAVLSQIQKEDDGEVFNVLEFARPVDWDEDRVRMFAGLVGHYAMEQARKIGVE